MEVWRVGGAAQAFEDDPRLLRCLVFAESPTPGSRTCRHWVAGCMLDWPTQAEAALVSTPVAHALQEWHQKASCTLDVLYALDITLSAQVIVEQAL